ncbi:MAG: threonine synthase [Pseudomonadota bacterium]
MRYVSTRAVPGEARQSVSASEAIALGLAADGGLFSPERLPQIDWGDAGDAPLDEIATRFLTPFFEGDALAPDLADICADAFNFPIELVPLPGERLSILELFHGPTAAFKDFGARFLAACFSRLHGTSGSPLTILVATSGDTGGAVAAAFHRRPGIFVDVLFPDGQVSPRQAQQLTCWGDNIRAFRVDGPFDACQSLVKAAFVDEELNARRRLSSANSINLGRLLPQASYYVWASLVHRARTGNVPSFIVPTGNLGNALACVWARDSGAPIGDIHFATNDNRTVPEFVQGAPWAPRPSVATVANAMDVGNPSNMERLRALYDDDALRQTFTSSFVDDAAIRAQIPKDLETRGQVLCPHTATATCAYDRDFDADHKAATDMVVVATAHPAKFETVVEPLIGREVAVPDNLKALLDLPSHAIDLAPDLDEFRRHFS